MQLPAAISVFIMPKPHRGDKVIVSSDAVPEPLEVRYAWADDAGEANLYNQEGFPAVPFRTDQWKGITDGKKYEIGK